MSLTYNNKVRADIFISALIFFSFLFGLGLLSSLGAGDDDGIVSFLGRYILYLFPIVFFTSLMQENSFSIVIVLVILNILIYSIVLFALFANKLSRSKKYKPFDLIHFIAYLIPSIFLVLFIMVQLGL